MDIDEEGFGMRIDAHNHPDYQNKSFDAVIENMNQNGIDKTCLLSWENPLDENDPRYYYPSPVCDTVTIPFTRCVDFYEKAPDRFILGYAPDPRKPQAIQKMKMAMESFDVKICGEVKFRMLYDNPDCLDLFRFCGEQGLPVVLHLDIPEAQPAAEGSVWNHWWYGGGMDMLERVLKACPETNFLGHAPAFWATISNDEKWKTEAYPLGEVIPGGLVEQFLDQYDNLYCDCSAGSACRALSRDPEYTKKLMHAHPDRFVFARDNFLPDLINFYDSLELPIEMQELFYHGNIERLIGLR